jgi:succinate-acetate transporter protein
MVLAMGIFYGGIAQVIAAIMEFKKDNIFGATAFGSFGLFWFTLAFLLIMPAMGWGEAPETAAMVSYLIMWGIFTGVMFIATLKLSRALQVVFASLTILFFLLAISNATGSVVVTRIAGIEGIFCGLSAIYAALAQVLNSVYGKTVMPLGQVK